MIAVATFIGEQLTVPQAAKYLGYSVHTLRAYLKKGLIVGQKFGNDWAIPKKECDRYQREKRPRGNPSFKKSKNKKKK